MIFFTDFFANNLVVYQKTLVFSICFLKSFHYQSTSLYLSFMIIPLPIPTFLPARRYCFNPR